MILNKFNIRNVIDYSMNFNIKELWDKSDEFLLFLSSLYNDVMAMDDINALDGDNLLENEDRLKNGPISRKYMLKLVQGEDFKQLYNEIFKTDIDKKSYPYFCDLRSKVDAIYGVKKDQDKVTLFLMYYIVHRDINQQEALEITSFFPNLVSVDEIKENEIVFHDLATRIDMELFVCAANVKGDIKQIKNTTDIDKTIYILNEGKTVFTYLLRPGKTIYCIMSGEKFIKKLKTIAMGRTYCAYLEQDRRWVKNVPLLETKGAHYEYKDMISFAVDTDKGIIGFSNPEDNDDSNVIAAVEIDDVPRNIRIHTASIFGSQYLMIREDGIPIMNIYGSERFENLIDGAICLNMVAGIDANRILITNISYTGKRDHLMSISVNQGRIAVLTYEGEAYLQGNKHPVSEQVMEIGLCRYGLFALKKDGHIYRASEVGESLFEEIGGEIVEISVSDTGLMYRTRNDEIGIYYFNTKKVQKLC